MVAYFRTKVSPSQQASQYANVRARFTTISQAWRGLLEVPHPLGIMQFRTFKGTDVLALSHSPSGFIFTKVDNNSLTVGGSVLHCLHSLFPSRR